MQVTRLSSSSTKSWRDLLLLAHRTGQQSQGLATDLNETVFNLVWTHLFRGLRRMASRPMGNASRPRFGCYPLLPTGAYLGLLMHTVILISVWLPISSGLSACYYPN